MEIENILITCDISTNTPTPYVPHNFQKQIFDKTHNLAHTGIKATTTNITRKFVCQKVNMRNIVLLHVP